jgi:ankyrin repeat protein
MNISYLFSEFEKNSHYIELGLAIYMNVDFLIAGLTYPIFYLPMRCFILLTCFIFIFTYIYAYFTDDQLMLSETMCIDVTIKILIYALNLVMVYPSMTVILGCVISLSLWGYFVIGQKLFNSLEDKLYFAIIFGQKRIVENIIERGADINAKRRSGDTPINLAIRNDQVEIIRILIENGADINARGKYGLTPLHLANNSELAIILLNNGADINAKSESGNTPLICAIVTNKLDIVKILIENGADINAKSESGNTPLIRGLVNNQVDINLIRTLIENGADINAKSESGNTPLHCAIFAGRLDSIKILIENGADINLNCNGSTPLSYAKSHATTEIVNLLINKSNEIKRNNNGINPLRSHEIIPRQRPISDRLSRYTSSITSKFNIFNSP